ncbi:MAG TPA: MATE family efflux transporter [bacterium]|nr:MATE family efflux transporter [bacterium]HPQ65307.1 MATE family efflux transporter [bacterium]
MLGMMSQVILNISDAAMVGHLEPISARALAATGLGSMVFMVLAVTFEALGIGTQILVSRRWGEKSYEAAGKVLFNSLLLTAPIGLVLSGLAISQVLPFVGLLVRDDQVRHLVSVYVRIRFISLFFYLTMASFRGYFDGVGKTRIRMESMIIVVVLNIFLNYLLIYGKWIFPRLEVAGAALASTIAVVSGSAYILICAFRDTNLRYCRFFSPRHLCWDWMKRIVYFSFPRGVRMFLTFSAFLLLFKIVGMVKNDVVSLAASNVLLTILSFSFMPGVGIGIAGATLIGQSLGARKYAAARSYGWGSARFGMGFTGLVGLGFIVFAGPIISVFTDDPGVADLAYWPLIVLGLTQVFLGAGTVLSQCLDGAGDTHWVMRAELLIYWLFLIPAAYLATVVMGWGIVGGWAAFGVMTVVYSLTMALKFSTEKWMKIAA